jgi:hypothetical protein
MLTHQAIFSFVVIRITTPMIVDLLLSSRFSLFFPLFFSLSVSLSLSLLLSISFSVPLQAYSTHYQSLIRCRSFLSLSLSLSLPFLFVNVVHESEFLTNQIAFDVDRRREEKESVCRCTFRRLYVRMYACMLLLLLLLLMLLTSRGCSAGEKEMYV